MIKWIGQHIWDFVSRFRNDVYLEDISTGTIASGGNLGLDSNNKIVKASAGDALSFDGSTANGILTYKDADEISVEALFTYTPDDLVMTGTGSGKPTFSMVNANADAEAPAITFSKQSSSNSSDGDNIGEIIFSAYNSANEITSFAKILGEISEVDDTDEAGKLSFFVGESDGSTSALTAGLILEGEHATDGQIDVTIGSGTLSTTTIAGKLNITRDFTLDSVAINTIQTASESFADNDTSLMTSAAIDDRINAAGGGADGWHGSTSRIKLLHRDFIADDGGRPAMIDDTGAASENFFLESFSSNPLYATVAIPTGFKATHVMVYGSATDAVEVWEHQINSKTGVSKGTGNVDTEINITDVTSSTTNYLFIQVANASGNEVHGGYVTIAAV